MKHGRCVVADTPDRRGKNCTKKIICLQENEFKIAEMEKIFKKILVFYIEFLYNIKGQKHRTGG